MAAFLEVGQLPFDIFILLMVFYVSPPISYGNCITDSDQCKRIFYSFSHPKYIK